jgi:hypothetical protein
VRGVRSATWREGACVGTPPRPWCRGARSKPGGSPERALSGQRWRVASIQAEDAPRAASSDCNVALTHHEGPWRGRDSLHPAQVVWHGTVRRTRGCAPRRLSPLYHAPRPCACRCPWSPTLSSPEELPGSFYPACPCIMPLSAMTRGYGQPCCQGGSITYLPFPRLLRLFATEV